MAAASLDLRLANRRVSGGPFDHSLAREAGDEARGVGVVAAVDPQFAAGREALDERAAVEALEPRGPCRGGHRVGERESVDRRQRLVAQDGDGEPGIEDLVRAREAGEGQRQFTLRVAIMKLAGIGDDRPACAARDRAARRLRSRRRRCGAATSAG